MVNYLLNMQQIAVYRGNICVLNIPSWQVKQGELIAIIGPNGAGKSTLLSTINLQLPYSGQLYLFEQSAANVNACQLRRRCSLQLQDASLLEGTVSNNIILPLKLRGLNRQAITTKLGQCLQEFDCIDLAGRSVNSLSGGEKQRVCLARALISQPELLLLDESFSALDLLLRHKLLLQLRKHAQTHNMTVLSISHNIIDALTFADRIVAIENGKITQDDDTATILRYPATATIARIIEIDNIITNPITLYSVQKAMVLSQCCFPGSAVALANSKTKSQNTITGRGLIVRIIPAIGDYRLLIEYQNYLLTARIPPAIIYNEQLSIGASVDFSISIDEINYFKS